MTLPLFPSRADSQTASPRSTISRSPRSDNLSHLYQQAEENLSQKFTSHFLEGKKVDHILPLLKSHLLNCSFTLLAQEKQVLKEILGKPGAEELQDLFKKREKQKTAYSFLSPLIHAQTEAAYEVIEQEILTVFQTFTDMETIYEVVCPLFKSAENFTPNREYFLLTLLKMAVYSDTLNTFKEHIGPLLAFCEALNEINLTDYVRHFKMGLKEINLDEFKNLVLYRCCQELSSSQLYLIDKMGFKKYINKKTPRQESSRLVKLVDIFYKASKQKASSEAEILALDLKRQCIHTFKQALIKHLINENHKNIHFGLTDYYNALGRLVNETILNEVSAKGRTKLAEFWIDVTDKLVKIHDYHSAISIIHAFSLFAIDRLKPLWQGISDKHKQMKEEFEKLFSVENNFANLRRKYIESGNFYIPFMGILLKDVSLIEQSNPTFIEGEINPVKRELIGAQLMAFREIQKRVSIEGAFQTDVVFALLEKKRSGSDLLLNRSYEIQPPSSTPS